MSTVTPTPPLPQVHELIQNRWSPRAFSDRQVSRENLRVIFDAAHWAASSYNEQPWRFIVATKENPDEYQKMLSLLVPFNQNWAKTAPALILMVAKKTFTHNSTPNTYAFHDAGAALAHLMLQTTALGLHAHGMAGFDRDRARTELNIPDDYEIAAFVALGYVDPAAQITTRQRKPLSELVFTTGWQTPFPLD